MMSALPGPAKSALLTASSSKVCLGRTPVACHHWRSVQLWLKMAHIGWGKQATHAFLLPLTTTVPLIQKQAVIFRYTCSHISYWKLTSASNFAHCQTCRNVLSVDTVHTYVKCTKKCQCCAEETLKSLDEKELQINLTPLSLCCLSTSQLCTNVWPCEHELRYISYYQY